ncbi:unnamed protein product [Sphagnum compactum]
MHQDPDNTLKHKTLDLLYKMRKSSNVEVIMENMIRYMQTLNDAHNKTEIAGQVIKLAERFAPSNQWFIQVLVKMMKMLTPSCNPLQYDATPFCHIHAQLHAKQAKQRKEFLHNEAHMCYQQPLPTAYGHYSYTRSEPSYTDSLPYDHTDSGISHCHPSVYESYSDTGVASYNRKHGQDGCKVYSKSQVYETSSYLYVGSPPYPAYG